MTVNNLRYGHAVPNERAVCLQHYDWMRNDFALTDTID
jgi:hypothetical protein